MAAQRAAHERELPGERLPRAALASRQRGVFEVIGQQMWLSGG